MCAELVLHWAVNPAGVIPNCGIVTHHHSHLDASLSERLRALLVIRKTEIRVLQLAPTIYASVSGIGNTPHFQCGFYLRVRVPSDAPRFNARYSRGQRGQTVNLLPFGFGSSNLPLAKFMAPIRLVWYGTSFGMKNNAGPNPASEII